MFRNWVAPPPIGSTSFGDETSLSLQDVAADTWLITARWQKGSQLPLAGANSLAMQAPQSGQKWAHWSWPAKVCGAHNGPPYSVSMLPPAAAWPPEYAAAATPTPARNRCNERPPPWLRFRGRARPTPRTGDEINFSTGRETGGQSTARSGSQCAPLSAATIPRPANRPPWTTDGVC